MPKEEWGTKRLCPHCQTRFYDLRQDPMTCPACSATFTADSLIAGRGRALVSEKATRETAAETDVVADEELEEDSSDVELDDDLLEDDEDDTVSLDDIADVAEGDDET